MSSIASGLDIKAEALPLRWDAGGSVRVGDSRISFDLVVEQFENGMTPEHMVRVYETLLLADVHAAISYGRVAAGEPVPGLIVTTND